MDFSKFLYFILGCAILAVIVSTLPGCAPSPEGLSGTSGDLIRYHVTFIPSRPFVAVRALIGDAGQPTDYSVPNCERIVPEGSTGAISCPFWWNPSMPLDVHVEIVVEDDAGHAEVLSVCNTDFAIEASRGTVRIEPDLGAFSYRRIPVDGTDCVYRVD